ncbi:hypothetical protein RB653_003180 [Dictyostelium firmibasis]|uniref:EGF-like domain-containing protein n=1 Tax=Dictyostelium firmibasis TaxID=79012 RepID=A0AAN7YW78_9MYCE
MLTFSNNFFISIWFLFIIFFIYINSQTLNQKEYGCMETLLTNLGTISKVFKNSTNTYEFCQTYDYFPPEVQVYCDQNFISSLTLGQSNKSFIIGDEFLCFENLTYLSLNGSVYNNSILYWSIPLKTNFFKLEGDNLEFSKLEPSISSFTANLVKQMIPTQIKLSYFTNLDQLFISASSVVNIGSHLVYIDNDLDGSFMWKASNIEIISLKIPSFKYIETKFLKMTLLPGFDESSWDNITTFERVYSLVIKTSGVVNFPSLALSQLRAENLTTIWFDSNGFYSVNSLVDLSSISKSIQHISFSKVTRNFSFGGLFPIILPTNEIFDTVVFQDGFIRTIDLSPFTNVKSLLLRNNTMAGSFPSFFNRTVYKKLVILDLSENQITGTIDDSFCELDISITNNKMNGSIPSCFTCFFGLSLSLESRFVGNSFSNIHQPSSPSIISPNFMFENQVNISNRTLTYFFIFGLNLGGFWVASRNVLDQNLYSVEVLIPNKLIRATSYITLPEVIYLTYNYSDPNYIFALSTGNTKPKANKINWQVNSINLVFDGSFFTYNKSIVNITIGNDNCLVTNTTFYQINCTLPISIDQSLQDILSFITVGNLTTQFTLNPGVVNQILNCTQYNDCNGGGYCLSDVGECKCDSNHQGIDCSLPYIECNPTNCHGNGVCVNTTGKCKCDQNHQGDDCSLQFVECLNDCNNNIGKCNNQTGICLCPTNPYGWDGIDCSIPLHTISAVLPSNTKGGNASIYGWFGNIHSNLQVFIGNKECKPIYNTSEFEMQTKIKCNAPAGTGLQSVSVIQNSINVTAKDIYQYYSTDKTCPNDCTSTSNGICNTTTGYCNCLGRWSGYDCSLYSNPSGGDNGGLPGSNSTIDNNTGNTNITNQQTNYQILITKLVELDFSGKSIKEYTLLNKWTIYSNNSKTIYTFIQSIQNDQCNITYTIEEINKDREVSFADVIFKLTSGSVKMTVSIENYQYSSNLNTLQLQMKSSVNNIQTNDINDCNNDQIEIDNKSNQDNSLNYIAIKKDAKVLNGRFIDRIESDGKSTFMQTVLVSKSNDSITVGMNLPHCTKKCLIDPDFSVLVSPEFVDECPDDKRKSWVLPTQIKKMFLLKYLFFYIIIFVCVNSQTLNQNEYDCMETLLTNLGTISNVNINSTTSEYEFCKTQIFSQPTVYISCDQGSISSLNLGQSNMSYVLNDQFLCFNNMTSLFLNIVIYNSSILYNSLPQKTERLDILGDNITISQLPPTIKYLSIKTRTQTIPIQIKLSWFSNLQQLSIYTSNPITLGSHLITFENDFDGSFIWKPSFIYIMSLNIPSLKYISGYLEIILILGFDQSSWSNISTCESLTTIFISTNEIMNFPSTQFSQIRAENLTEINIRGEFSNVSNLIDLSLVGKSIETLTLLDCGRNFSFGGLLPINLPTNDNFGIFTLNTAFIETIDLSPYSNVKTLKLVDNLMSGSFPSKFNRTNFKKLIGIDISYNQVTGTIDDSFCELDITVANNLMNGTIPSCFTCFFGIPSINLENRFMGNNFTNLNQPSSPSIIVPNVMQGNIKNFTYFLEYELFIFGENIGGSWIPYNAFTTESGNNFNFVVIIPNKLIRISSYLKPPSLIYIVYSNNNPNYIFTLSTDNTPPKLNTVDWQSSLTELVFDGSYFTYNKSIVNITIGNDNCLITNLTFYQITCKLSNVIDQSLQDILSFITVGNLTTQFTLNPGVVNQILNCSQYNDCNGGGYCLSDVGECKCDSNHQGIDCSLPYIECNPTNCHGNGVCVNTTGKCKCDQNHQGDDCSLQFVECLNDCNNNIGKCNNQTGICLCPTNPYGWDGIDCSIPLHTISAVSPSNTKGGNASIYGWFGNIHSNLQVFIGNKECKPIYNTTEFEIKCNAPAGTGLQSVSVIQNSINVTAKDIYQYYSTDKTCPNDCTSTSNGICNTTTGYCNCIGRWSGYDCSLYSNPSGGDNGELPGSNTTIDNNTGGTNITNQQTNYQILITKLVEIDFSGKSIKEYILLNKWTIYSNNSKTIYTFIQSIQNDQCNITYTIEEINKDREVSFAGIIFKLTSGSVKMTVSIENYQYSSNLNTLQLQMKSSVNNIQTNDINDCNNDQIEIDNKSNQDNSLNYIAIKKDAKVLNGRFIDRIESDGKSTFMQTVLVSKSNDSITVGMNLPHCVKKCLIDPDFSVLISSEFIDECGNDKRESWFLPVLIAVPVGGVAAIAAIVYLIYKKRFIEAPLKRKLQRISTSKN